MNTTGRRYTAAEEALVREMYAAGKRTGDIARALGRSTDSVRLHSYRMGLTTEERGASKYCKRDWVRDDSVLPACSTQRTDDLPPYDAGQLALARRLRAGGPLALADAPACWRSAPWSPEPHVFFEVAAGRLWLAAKGEVALAVLGRE